MAAKVDIYNQALGRLGIIKNVTVTSGTADTDLISKYYEQAVEEELRLRDWAFARRTEQLTALTTTDIPGLDIGPLWTYAFNFPSDWAASRRIAPPSALAYEEQIPFDKMRIRATDPNDEVVCLVTNYVADDTADTLYLEYTAYAAGREAEFDPHFVKVMSYRVATEIALAKTQDQTWVDNMKAGYAQALTEALQANAWDSHPLKDRDKESEDNEIVRAYIGG